jgi:hypothetical protein
MKNTLKQIMAIRKIAAIALLVAAAFSFAACDMGGGSGGGTLTLTDIPAEYNGKYVFFEASGRNGLMDLIVDGCQDYKNSAVVRIQINNGSAVIPLLISGDLPMKPYNGNDTFEDILVSIYETPIGEYYEEGGNLLGEFGFPPITFSNGSASISWNDSGDEWSNTIPLHLVGSWYFFGEWQELFAIESDGSGSIRGQGGYTVQISYNPREVRFTKGNSEAGRFSYRVRGDGDIYIASGTGPFTSWVMKTGGDFLMRVGNFTLTDIPSQYNGKYALFRASDSNYHFLEGYLSSQNNDNAYTLPQISNGRVSLPLRRGWGAVGSGYSGNDTYVTVSNDPVKWVFIRIVSDSVIPATTMYERVGDVYFSSVTFSLGRAAKSYNDRMQ